MELSCQKFVYSVAKRFLRVGIDSQNPKEGHNTMDLPRSSPTDFDLLAIVAQNTSF